MSATLLSADFLARLEQLQLTSRKIFAGRIRGERRSAKKGQSVEFADYRDYAPGDDLRFIDWNIYSRLDRLFVKLFMEEQDLQFSVLLDTSASMQFGDPSKLEYGRRLAAALAYIGLTNLDRVVIAGIGNTVRDMMPPSRGRNAVWRMFSFLENLTADGTTSLVDACRAFAIRQKRRGIVLLISDFMDPAGYEDALRVFLNRRDDLYVLHVLAREELDPDLAGHLRLVDSETGAYTEVTVSAAVLQRYRQTVRAYCGAVHRFCTQRGIQYLSASTSLDFEQLILTYLRQRGMLR